MHPLTFLVSSQSGLYSLLRWVNFHLPSRLGFYSFDFVLSNGSCGRRYADAETGVLLAVPANIDHRPSTFVTRWVLKPPLFSRQTVVFSPRFNRPASCWLLIGCWPSPICFQTFSNILTTSTLSTNAGFWLAAIYNSQSKASILVLIWELYFTYHTTFDIVFKFDILDFDVISSNNSITNISGSIFLILALWYRFSHVHERAILGETGSIYKILLQYVYAARPTNIHVISLQTTITWQ